MKTRRINTANRVLCCAFCVHWFDPALEHIHPTGDPFMKIWEYDTDVKSMCEVQQKEFLSQCCCNKFEKKSMK